MFNQKIILPLYSKQLKLNKMVKTLKDLENLLNVCGLRENFEVLQDIIHNDTHTIHITVLKHKGSIVLKSEHLSFGNIPLDEVEKQSFNIFLDKLLMAGAYKFIDINDQLNTK